MTDRWWKDGDHHKVVSYNAPRPNVIHVVCGAAFGIHGWLETPQQMVCPGDYIVRRGAYVAERPDPFKDA